MGINGPLQCAPGSECICKDDSKLSRVPTRCAMLTISLAYSQCRKQIGGIWSNSPTWQCQKPGDVPTGSVDYSSANTSISGGSSNPIGYSALGNSGEAGAGEIQPADISSSSSTTAPQHPASKLNAATAPSTSSMDTTSDMAPDVYANASASVGGCSSLGVPGGWDGVASTSVCIFARTILTIDLTSK